jgi:hypothetical protein
MLMIFQVVVVSLKKSKQKFYRRELKREEKYQLGDHGWCGW